MNRRIKWIDVARCFGIFAVFLGHFGQDAGRMTNFLYTHHVALFFFLSGCMAPRDDSTLTTQIKKTATGLVLPWLTFAFAAAAFETVYMNNGISGFLSLVKQILKGTIVDEYVAGGLWFLICLAIMRLFFHILRKLRYPAIILTVSLAMYLVEQVYPIPEYYNLHRLFQYTFYYALGFFAFPYVCRVLSAGTRRGRILLTLSSLFSLGFAALVYFGRNPLDPLWDIPIIGSLTLMFRALVIIWLYLLVAKLLENVEIFNKIGRKTLYLCGSEYFIRLLLKSAVRLFGLELAYPRPVCAWLCAALCVYLALRYLVPVEERIFAALRRFPGWILEKGQEKC